MKRSVLEAYLSLFASSLVAATLIPAQSEALLVGLIVYQPTQVALLILVASVGNVLGALINWTLGRFLRKLLASACSKTRLGSVESLLGMSASDGSHYWEAGCRSSVIH